MRNGEAPTDVGACSKGFVSVTPITLDWTHHAQVEALKQSLNF
jgi:broad specificity polyphosphatase/5'/3'-nucleotidase SurE